MKVYGASLSPFVRKVLVVLKIKGLPYEQELVFPGSPDPEYRKISPLGKIPALVDGDLVTPDSSIICEYLEEQYPEVSLMPSSTVDRAKARWFEEFADSKLAELCGGGIFYEKVVKPVLLQQETNEEKVENTITKKLPPIQDYLESQLPKEGFLFDKITTADISIATHFINAEYAGYQVDASKWPILAGFIDRVKAVPEMVDQLAEDQKTMKELFGS